MVVIRLSLRSRPKNHKHYQMLVSDQRRSTKELAALTLQQVLQN